MRAEGAGDARKFMRSGVRFFALLRSEAICFRGGGGRFEDRKAIANVRQKTSPELIDRPV